MGTRDSRQSLERTLLLLMLVSALAGGCAGAYRDLSSEDRIAELAMMKEASRALPLTTCRVPVAAPNGRVVHVAMHECGPADAPRAIVMIHGVLSDAEVWRFIRGSLGREHRLILVDLPGSGASDAPTPRELGTDGYAPEALAAMVLQAVDQRFEATRPAERITLVGHSLGGLIVVRMLSDESIGGRYGEVLARVDGAVLFTPIDVALEKELPVFRTIAVVSDVEVGIARVTGILQQKCAQSTVEGVADPAMATREEADRTYRILATTRIRHAQQAMLRQAVPWLNRRPDWERMERITARYGTVRTPCLIVWGARDELFPLSMGYKLAMEIPAARLRIVPEAMHSIPTEHPATCAALIEGFVADTELARRSGGGNGEPPPAAKAIARLATTPLEYTSAWRVAAGWLGSYLVRDAYGDRNQAAPSERISRTSPARRRAADRAG